MKHIQQFSIKDVHPIILDPENFNPTYKVVVEMTVGLCDQQTPLDKPVETPSEDQQREYFYESAKQMLEQVRLTKKKEH